MDEHSAEKLIGKLLSELYRAHTAEPFITFETIDMILDGFSELDIDHQKAFADRMVKYLTAEYSEVEMILLSREIMTDIRYMDVVETDNKVCGSQEHSNSYYRRVRSETLLKSGYSHETKLMTLKYLNESATWEEVQVSSQKLIELYKSSETEDEFIERLNQIDNRDTGAVK